MKVMTETKELTNDNLRLLSKKTGKSVRTLKREKNSYSYLGYNAYNGGYRFLRYSAYLSEYTIHTPKRFFELIGQEQLLGLLK